MGVSSAVFESAGKRTEHYVPGVYSRSYNVTSASGISSGNLCILGSASGGEPQTLLEFESVADAKNTLVSGDLLNAVAYAFNGSTEFVPQKVYAMRVNSGTRSSLTIKSGDAVNMTLYAWDYGVHTNQLKMTIAKGTATNSKKVTFAYKDTTSEIDNIVQSSLKLLTIYDSASVTTSDSAMYLTYNDAEGNSKSVTVSYDDFPKLSELVEKLNSITETVEGEEESVFTATLLDSDSDALSANLDVISSQSVTESGTTLYSNRKAFIDAVKTVEFISEVVEGSSKQAPENMSVTYFTGGASSTATNSDWISALENLEVEDIQIIATPNTTSDVQTLIANHCSQMSTTTNRKERTCILGGAIGMTDADAITSAAGFNNKLVSFVVDNAIASNPITGDTETISGAMLGCMLAGMESSMSPHIPLTNKSIHVLGFSKKRTISNMEKLIKGGILVCNPSPDNMSNYVVIRGLTTYQTSDLISNERSMVREDLFMNRDLRQAFNSSIGTPNNAGTSSIIATLKMKGKEWNDNGYIIPDDSSNNVWNISVKVDGDKIYLTYSRYLTAPTNFIFITATNHIYTSTVEV